MISRSELFVLLFFLPSATGLVLEVDNVTDTWILVGLRHEDQLVLRQAIVRIYELTSSGTFALIERREFIGTKCKFTNLRPATFYLMKFNVTGTVSHNQQTAPIDLSIAARTNSNSDPDSEPPELSETLAISRVGKRINITVARGDSIPATMKLVARPEVSQCDGDAEFPDIQGDYLDPMKIFSFNISTPDVNEPMNSMPKCERICIQHFIEMTDPENSEIAFVEADRMCENFNEVVAKTSPTNVDPTGDSGGISGNPQLKKVIPETVNEGRRVTLGTDERIQSTGSDAIGGQSSGNGNENDGNTGTKTDGTGSSGSESSSNQGGVDDNRTEQKTSGTETNGGDAEIKGASLFQKDQEKNANRLGSSIALTIALSIFGSQLLL